MVRYAMQYLIRVERYQEILMIALGFLIIAVQSAVALKLSPYSHRRTLFKAEKSASIPITDKPKWAGGGQISDFVNFLISIKPIFATMKYAARRVLISTAEKNNVPWTETAIQLAAKDSILKSYYDSLNNPSIQFPEYYTQDFHAYNNGNLNWEAAYECESATKSMALRVYPKQSLTAEQAQDKLRGSYLNSVKNYITSSGDSIQSMSRIADIGCSVGISTFYIAESFPEANTIDGFDLSPYFLSVAKLRQAELSDKSPLLKKINWIHANMEDTGVSVGHYDLITVCFVVHELPDAATKSTMAELFRIVRPGGIIAITDNNPASTVIKVMHKIMRSLAFSSFFFSM